MDNTKILIASISFIIVGIIFLLIAFYIKFSKSAKQMSIYKSASLIFYIIGVGTFVLGIIFLVFKNQISKLSFELLVLVYLIFITISFSVFTYLIEGNKDDEQKHS